MPIPVGCQCGQRFAAPDNLAGKRVKCPKCGSPISIPAANSAATAPQATPKPTAAAKKAPVASAPNPVNDLFADAGFVAAAPGMTKCPNCQSDMAQQAVLCVKCGFDRRVGKQLKGVAAASSGGHDGHGDAASVLLARAAKTLAEDAAEEAKTRSQGMPAWAYGVLLVGLGIFTYYVMMTGIGQSLMTASVVIFFVAHCVSFYYLVRLLIVAFQEAPVQLLLNFVPCYMFYYVYSRWDKVGKYFIPQLMCAGVGILCYAMFFVGAMIVAANQAGSPTPN